MKSKDWEYHAALLHKHDSAKFNRPTKRMHESPVIEHFDQTAQFLDLVILVGSAAVLAIVVVLLVFKVMS
jgi:flagellar biosynthesis/type III secretory pathway M-ring protein FliF/YscJ